MNNDGFRFARGNLAKVLALPKYVLSVLVSWCVPRSENRWVFGSGLGVGEGALELARQLSREDPDANIVWLVANDAEAEAASEEGWRPIRRQSAAGYWATLRARWVVVTHGLGDANRFGIIGATVVQLWHGAPLKRLHLDSPVTTALRGPALLRRLLRRMYLAGSRQVDLYVAGSPLAADRLRSAFRVAPARSECSETPEMTRLHARRPSQGLPPRLVRGFVAWSKGRAE
ncbi:CDP-glycerol glycerophosphotransferase family protein [Leucobacter insecticola]|uniref:CDP-glycerol glycerophosphotransferase family protein n=1 Tax=Leucobacter insecticola TaxID=2714934 RepID=UPI00244E10A9|nr:CDP-glycerol glycerophosphotransferase family protein [Leucobacter insecticola]